MAPKDKESETEKKIREALKREALKKVPPGKKIPPPPKGKGKK